MINNERKPGSYLKDNDGNLIPNMNDKAMIKWLGEKDKPENKPEEKLKHRKKGG